MDADSQRLRAEALLAASAASAASARSGPSGFPCIGLGRAIGLIVLIALVSIIAGIFVPGAWIIGQIANFLIFVWWLVSATARRQECKRRQLEKLMRSF